MRKILLGIALLSVSFVAQSQVIFSEDFEGGTAFADGWTVIDVNTDGDQWQVLDLTGFGTIFDAQGYVALSSSTIPGQTGFSPDNILISPAIDLSSTTGMINLKFKVGSEMSTASGKYGEFLSVYLVTDASQANILATTPVHSQALSQGATLITYTIDVSTFIGQSGVKIAFRHHNCTDLSAIFLDDISIEKNTAGISQKEVHNLIYPNPVKDEVQFQLNENIESISVYNLSGELSLSMIGDNIKSMSLSALTPGMYLMKIGTKNNQIIHSKFYKN